MATRRPLALVNGTLAELPSGDLLAPDTVPVSAAMNVPKLLGIVGSHMNFANDGFVQTTSYFSSLVVDHATRLGLMRLQGQVSAGTGYANYHVGSASWPGITRLGGGVEYVYETEVAPALVLHDGTNTGAIRLGATLFVSGITEPDHGIFLRSVNGGNWFFVCRSSMTETTIDTGVAPVLGTFIKFRFVVNSTATSVTGYLNGVQIGSPITTNIPTVSVGPYVNITRTVANTATVGLDVDYFFFCDKASESIGVGGGGSSAPAQTDADILAGTSTEQRTLSAAQGKMMALAWAAMYRPEAISRRLVFHDDLMWNLTTGGRSGGWLGAAVGDLVNRWETKYGQNTGAMGAVAISTNTTSGVQALGYWGAGGETMEAIGSTRTAEIAARCRSDNTQSAGAYITPRFGLIKVEEVPVNGEPTNGIYFRAPYGSNWTLVCRLGGVETTLDSGVPLGFETYNVLRAIKVGTTRVELWANNTYIGQISTNIYTGVMGWFFGAAPGVSTTYHKVRYDWWQIQIY